MTLNKKMLLVVGTTAVILVTALFFASRTILLGSFARIEENQVQANLQRVLSALKNEVISLDVLAADWATWDDSYAFIVDGNQEYVESNLVDFGNTRINFLLFFDTSEQIKFSVGIDSTGLQEVPMPMGLLDYLEENKALVNHSNPESVHRGIIHLPSGPVLLASRPVITSAGEGPVRGALILGRSWTEGEVQRLGETTHMPVEILALDTPSTPDEFAALTKSFPEGTPFYTRVLNDDTIAGFTPVHDIRGTPRLLLKAEMPRNVYVQAKDSLRYYFASTALIGLAICVLVFLLVKKLVVNRLVVLAHEVRRIGTTSGSDDRVTVGGNDELTLLGTTINTMLENLDTSRKKLEESELKSRAWLENSPACTKIVDLDFNLQYMSAAGIIGLGIDDVTEFYGKPYPFEFYPDSFRTPMIQNLERVREHGKILTQEAAVVDLEGRELWFHSTLVPGRNQEGVIDYIIVVSIDITERKEAEAEREEYHARSIGVIRNSVDSIITINDDGIIESANPAAVSLFGHEESDLIGKHIKILMPEPHRGNAEQYINAYKKSGMKNILDTVLETEGVRRDSTIFPLRLSVSEVTFGNKRIFAGIIHDLSHEFELERQLLQAQKLESVGTLAGGIAHDFNNMLTGVFGFISLAKDNLSEDHAARKSLDRAEKSLTQATLLTGQLLTFAKGGAPVRIDLNLGLTVSEVVEFNLSGSNVSPAIEIEDDLWIANADGGQVRQVISNLVINARQSMPTGGHLYIHLENIEIKHGHETNLSAGKYVKGTIRDEGSGIERKYLDRVFEPYFSTKQTGSGLGLATAYSVMKRHGGHIGVDSKLGVGTTFTIYVPASGRPEQVVKKTLPAKESSAAGSARVLILDDDEIVRQVASAILKQSGYSAETADDGAEATKMYEEAMNAGRSFDVLIMDLTIPGGIGGKEALVDILKFDPRAKAIVSSGYADNEVMANYEDFGFKGVVTKPYTANGLHEVLKDVLDN
jgi:PAS domain S-box-containing protein